jgi:cytochrome c peroxidase
VQWAQNSGVKVVATFPNVAYNVAYNGPGTRETVESITRFYASIHVPVIGNAYDDMFPPDRFFDTNYHLMSDGVHDRTAQLIPKLTPYLPSK